MWVAKGLSFPITMTFLAIVYTSSLLDWLLSHPSVFLSSQPNFLASPTSWSLHYSFRFIPIASDTVLSGAPCFNPQISLWNLGGSTSDLTTHALCIPKQPASGGACKTLQQVQTGAEAPCTMAAAPSELPGDWAQWTNSPYGLSGTEGLRVSLLK